MGKKLAGKEARFCNTAMMDKLAALMPQKRFPAHAGRRPDTNARARLQLQDLGSIGEDGETHINIYNRGKTNLGVLLANNTELRFGHSLYGVFMTIEGFWRYIRTGMKDELFRTLQPERLLAFSKRYEQIVVPNFQAIIAEACWMKVKAYPELLEVLKATDLPFDSYFIDIKDKNHRTRPKFAYWMVSIYEEIRKALKEEREPDFKYLRDRREGELHDGLIARWEERRIELAKEVEKAAARRERNKAKRLAHTRNTKTVEAVDASESAVSEVVLSETLNETDEVSLPVEDVIIPEPVVECESASFCNDEEVLSENLKAVVNEYITACACIHANQQS